MEFVMVDTSPSRTTSFPDENYFPTFLLLMAKPPKEVCNVFLLMNRLILS